MPSLRFVPSCLDDVECTEDYRPGGFHPVAIADLFSEGRYREVVHKLGSRAGGSSTIWLAREQGGFGGLVTIKVMRASLSSNNLIEEVPELGVPLSISSLVPGAKVQTPKDYFVEVGPNGSHLCLVYPLAGPSILAMSFSPGRVAGSRRLRKDLAKKVAKQLACTVGVMHNSGFVHGGSWQYLSQKRERERERLAADKITQTLHRPTSYSALLKMSQSGRIKNFISTSASQRRRRL